jgi:hypothetical protein
MLRELTRQVGSADDAEREHLESLIRTDYEQCHPGETLEDLKHRATFPKAEKGLLGDGMEAAGRGAAANNTAPVVRASFLAAE